MRKNLFPALCILLSAVTLLGCLIAYIDTSLNVNALNAFRPIVDLFVKQGERFSLHAYPWFDYGAIAAVGVLMLLSVQKTAKNHRCLLAGAAIAIIAQLFFIDRELCGKIAESLALTSRSIFKIQITASQLVALPIGILGYIIACALVFRGLKSESKPAVFEQGLSESRQFGMLDLIILTSIFLVALIFRMYALNFIFDSFEGELSPYSAGATSLKGMFLANRGTNGPWAPLGILYYLPIYFTTKLFGTTLLALRLSSAVVGLLTVPLIYLLAARLGGRMAGHIASALFALNCLHIGWSRTDIHPHGVTTWPTLLMCWFLIKAFDTRKLSWACAVAAMMGLSWHQYPSGQSAVIIPFIAMGLYWITNRFSFPLRFSQSALISVGVGLWLVGLPLSYYVADERLVIANPFNLTGPRAIWGGDEVGGSTWNTILLVIQTASRQFLDVVQGVFYWQPYFFHQEWVPYTDMVAARTVAWLEVPFVFIGLCVVARYLSRFESSVLIAWLIAAILPGILSEHAYPKRLSTFFPALDIIAALGLTTLVLYATKKTNLGMRRFAGSTIALAMLPYAAFLSHFWFSGKFWRYNEPAEMAVARQIAQTITPGTIMVADLTRDYELGKYLYLLLDHLSDPKNRPNVWMAPYSSALPTLIADPLKSVELAPETLAYLWTKLRDQVSEFRDYTAWTRVVYLLQTGTPTFYPNDQAIAAASARCNNPKIQRINAVRTASNNLVLIECSVADLK